MQKIFYVLFFLSLGLLVFSCDANRVYEKNYDLPETKWYADSILTFEFEIEDIEQKYNIFYNVRFSINYSFYNMYLFYKLKDSKGNVVSSELQELLLSHPETGKPYGEGIGDIFSNQLAIDRFKNYQFKKKGKYTFTVQQYMRQNPLPNVLSFGLRLEKIEK